MNDVAIIGVGLHPFGATVTSRRSRWVPTPWSCALTDAGVPWGDVQCAFGGSWEVAQTDPLTGLIGLTGIPFINVFNACATGAAAIQQAANAILAGTGDIVRGRRHGQAPPGSFKVDPTLTNVPAWYGENGQFVTTKFFGMKINRYMHDHGISSETLAKVAAKNYRNGALNPKAFRRKAITEEEILDSPVLNYPLTSYMFCAPDEGAAAAGALPGRHRPPLHRDPGVRESDAPSGPATTVPSRSAPPGRPSKKTSPRPCTPPGPPTRRPGSGPRTST